MVVRSIKEEDIVEVRKLLDKGKPFVLPHHHYVYWMMCKFYVSSNFVAVDDNSRIAGFLCAIPDEKKESYFIWQIVVNEEYRGQGIGRKLLNNLLICANKEKIKKIVLTIDVNNNISKSMFEKFAKDMNSELKLDGEYKYEQAFDKVYSILL